MAKSAQTQQTTSLAKLDDNVVESIQTVVETCAFGSVEGFRQMLAVSNGIQQLRKILTPAIMSDVMSLQGSRLGFRTDKDTKGGYPPEVVRDCFIEALLRGAMPVGNEFNIISGQAYFTREYFERVVPSLPNLTNLKIIPGVPKGASGGAVVPMKATWEYRGVPDSLEVEIPVRINDGMIVDAILGKARRKLLAQIYTHITGRNVVDAEIGEDVPQVRRVENTAELPGPAETKRTRTEEVAAKIAGDGDDGDGDDAPADPDVAPSDFALEGS